MTESLLNKLVLGTVQFGLEYGVNNSGGKPSYQDSINMLSFAYENGISVFDTANAYGNAEEILGEFSETRNLGGKIKVITKLKPGTVTELKSKEEIYDVIADNLKDSLKKLRRSYVDGYLLHTPEYIRDEKIVQALCELKEQGLVKNIGVSVYEEEDALYAAKLSEVDYIQIPYSIFDQRLDKTDFFKLAKKNGITVFARSAFLQGLFFMPEEKIPPHLENAKPYLKKLDAIIAKYHLSRQQAALLFSLKNQ